MATTRRGRRMLVIGVTMLVATAAVVLVTIALRPPSPPQPQGSGIAGVVYFRSEPMFVPYHRRADGGEVAAFTADAATEFVRDRFDYPVRDPDPTILAGTVERPDLEDAVTTLAPIEPDGTFHLPGLAGEHLLCVIEGESHISGCGLLDLHPAIRLRVSIVEGMPSFRIVGAPRPIVSP